MGPGPSERDPEGQNDLRARSYWEFSEKAQQAATAGESGERLLVEALSRPLPKDRQVSAVASLGDATGPLGAAALRNVLTWTGTPLDLRCAAVLALAKRAKEAASADFAEAFRSSQRAVKSYALIALAAYGDGRSWEPVYEYLRKRLAVPTNDSAPTTEAYGVAYLARHLRGDESRLTRLVDLLRAKDDQARPYRINDEWHASCLTQHWEEGTAWLDRYWPQCLDRAVPTDRVSEPEVVAIERWTRANPLLGRAG